MVSFIRCPALGPKSVSDHLIVRLEGPVEALTEFKSRCGYGARVSGSVVPVLTFTIQVPTLPLHVSTPAPGVAAKIDVPAAPTNTGTPPAASATEFTLSLKNNVGTACVEVAHPKPVTATARCRNKFFIETLRRTGEARTVRSVKIDYATRPARSAFAVGPERLNPPSQLPAAPRCCQRREPRWRWGHPKASRKDGQRRFRPSRWDHRRFGERQTRPDPRQNKVRVIRRRGRHPLQRHNAEPGSRLF